jgi:hypothetical protein
VIKQSLSENIDSGCYDATKPVEFLNQLLKAAVIKAIDDSPQQVAYLAKRTRRPGRALIRDIFKKDPEVTDLMEECVPDLKHSGFNIVETIKHLQVITAKEMHKISESGSSGNETLSILFIVYICIT